MTSLVNGSKVLCKTYSSLNYVTVRHMAGKKKLDDPYLYKYDRWGRVKKLEKPGGRKNTPFDKRFPINPKDVAPTKLGGSIEVLRKIGRDKSRFPHPPGYIDDRGRFHLVKEMVPEFIVPDLTDFKLKPYVSYNVPEINQSQFTAEELFYATYAKEIGELYMRGKIKDTEKFQKNFEQDDSVEERLEVKMAKLALKSK